MSNYSEREQRIEQGRDFAVKECIKLIKENEDLKKRVSTMSKLDVSLVKFDDWQVLQINGEVVAQGNKITIEEFVRHLCLEDQGINFYSKFIDEIDYPELHEAFRDGDIETILEEI